jgi:hypothetical protein
MFSHVWGHSYFNAAAFRPPRTTTIEWKKQETRPNWKKFPSLGHVRGTLSLSSTALTDIRERTDISHLTDQTLKKVLPALGEGETTGRPTRTLSIIDMLYKNLYIGIRQRRSNDNQEYLHYNPLSCSWLPLISLRRNLGLHLPPRSQNHLLSPLL